MNLLKAISLLCCYLTGCNLNDLVRTMHAIQSRTETQSQRCSDLDSIVFDSRSRTNSGFQEHVLFFYGTLMIPSILQSILNLSEIPTLHPARIRSFSLKSWGPYPVAIPSTDDCVLLGKVYTVKSYAHLLALERYETKKYQRVPCQIEISGQEGFQDGWTFVWSSEDLRGLRDGHWDEVSYMSGRVI